MTTIELFDSLMQTSYSQAQKELIIDIILNTFINQTSIIYLLQRPENWGQNYESLYFIFYNLLVPYSGKTYSISMFIILSIGFPVEEPEIYFQTKPNLGINSSYVQQNIINPSTLRLNYDSLFQWDSNIPDFTGLFQALTSTFAQVFPLSKNLNSNMTYNGICNINTNELKKVVSGKEGISNEPIQPNNQPQQQPSPVPIKSPVAIKTEFCEADIKNVLQKEIESKTSAIVAEQLTNIYKDREQLIALKRQLTDKLNSDIDQSKGIVLQSTLDSLRSSAYKQESSLTELCAMKESMKQTQITFHNLNDIANIQSPELLRLICTEKVIEEYCLSLKRLLEKESISFMDGVKDNLRLGRELFNIKYLKKKYMDEHQ